jgi:hypothetical protein
MDLVVGCGAAAHYRMSAAVGQDNFVLVILQSTQDGKEDLEGLVPDT